MFNPLSAEYLGMYYVGFCHTLLLSIIFRNASLPRVPMGTSGQIRSARKWYHWTDLGESLRTGFAIGLKIGFGLEFLNRVQSYESLNIRIYLIPN